MEPGIVLQARSSSRQNLPTPVLWLSFSSLFSTATFTIHHNSSQFCFCSTCLAWVIWAWSPVRWALTSQTRHINCSRIRWDNQHRWQTSAVTFGVLVELILRRHLSATDEPGIAILQALPILWNKRGCQQVSTTFWIDLNSQNLTNRNALCDSILQSAGTKAQSESRPCPMMHHQSVG